MSPRALPLLALGVFAPLAAAPLRLGTSEALQPAVRRWADGWQQTGAGQARVLGEAAGATSAAAVTDSLEGRLDGVFTGRPLRAGEAKAYADKFGGPPLLFAVATPRPYGKENRSALGLLVHRDNPLASLTLAQIDAVFSAERRRGAAPITTWGQLGLGGEWAAAPIRACAPEADSGTGQYFTEAVLWGGTLAPQVQQLPRLTDAIVRAVAADKLAFGLTTLNFATDGVRAVAVAARAGATAFAPTDEHCGSLDYPLTRQVYLCLNPAAAGATSSALPGFVRFVLGPRGQALATESGFVPLSAGQVNASRAHLESAPRKTGADFRLESLALEMKWIPPGEFDLGSPDNEGSRGVDEGPLTRVKITQGFWLGRTEVTQAQWHAVMGTTPSRFKGPVLPVEQISWHDALEYGRRVTAAERAAGRLPAGYEYSLPTESQWEHAAEAGVPEGVPRDVDDQAWHDQNSGGSTHPVEQKKPNRNGLHDTLGNVWEWCADWYAPYPGGQVADYAGPPAGASSAKANRGGSWWAGPRGQRTANRYRDMPQNGNDDLGFRLALVPAR